MRETPTVACCLNNVNLEEYQTYLDADIEVEMQHCLQRCGVCHDSPFLVVDTDLTRDDSHDTLLTTLSNTSDGD